MHILGLTGQPFNGKDTASRYLEDVHGFHPIAFADPLRAGIKAMLGLTDADFSPERKERVIHWLGKTPVQLLESLGTTWGQTELYRQVWCDRAVHTMTALLDSKRRFVFTDVRFVHEAKMLQQFDGKLLRIVRPGAPRSTRAGCASFQEQLRLVADADCIVKHLMTQQPLRIIHDKDGTYFVCYGEGLTFKCFAAALTLKAAKSVCADINRRPWYYGA